MLYQSAAKAFVDTGVGYKFSDPFSFALQTGVTYGLTATSDVGGTYFVDDVANNVGAFQFLTGNQNLSGTFAAPTLDLGQQCCDVGTALVVGENNVPEPASSLLIGLGMIGMAACRRRRIA